MKTDQQADRVRVNLWIDKINYRKLRHISIEKKVSATEILNKLVANYIIKYNEKR